MENVIAKMENAIAETEQALDGLDKAVNGLTEALDELDNYQASNRLNKDELAKWTVARKRMLNALEALERLV